MKKFVNSQHILFHIHFQLTLRHFLHINKGRQPEKLLSLLQLPNRRSNFQPIILSKTIKGYQSI